jgi:hypothetical protein
MIENIANFTAISAYGKIKKSRYFANKRVSDMGKKLKERTKENIAEEMKKQLSDEQITEIYKLAKIIPQYLGSGELSKENETIMVQLINRVSTKIDGMHEPGIELSVKELMKARIYFQIGYALGSKNAIENSIGLIGKN